MPIYNFRCKKCGHSFEAIVGLGVEILRCPRCYLMRAFKQFTPTHFIPFRSFIDTDMTGQPIEIGSPRQFSKELHSRGLEIADRPVRHKQKKKKGLSESTKKLFAEKLSKEMGDHAIT